jgi:hypothetical protein
MGGVPIEAEGRIRNSMGGVPIKDKKFNGWCAH